MPAVVVNGVLAPVPSVSVTLCGTRSSSASPASGIAVLGEVDIWIGWACTPSPASAWPTVGAVVQTSRCDGPSSRISLRARLKMTWSPLSIVVGRAGSTRSCGAASMPAACSADATSPANVCTDAVLAVDGHGDRLVHGHRGRPAADQGEQEGERGGADGEAAGPRGGWRGDVRRGGCGPSARERRRTAAVIGSSATGPVRWSSRSGPMAGMGAVIGPASGTATRPVSRADRPGADGGASSSARPRSSSSGSTQAGCAPGSGPRRPRLERSDRRRSTAGARDGATTPGRSVPTTRLDGRTAARSPSRTRSPG